METVKALDVDNTGLLTLDQVAAAMSVVRKTAGRWCRDGDLQAKKVFGQWLVEPGQLEIYKHKRATKKVVRRSPSPTMIVKPKRARRKPLGFGSANMRRVHERADQIMAARAAFINKKFPPGNGHTRQEVFEYVLYNMPPRGLRDSEKDYEDTEVYDE